MARSSRTWYGKPVAPDGKDAARLDAGPTLQKQSRASLSAVLTGSAPLLSSPRHSTKLTSPHVQPPLASPCHPAQSPRPHSRANPNPSTQAHASVPVQSKTQAQTQIIPTQTQTQTQTGMQTRGLPTVGRRRSARLALPALPADAVASPQLQLAQPPSQPQPHSLLPESTRTCSTPDLRLCPHGHGDDSSHGDFFRLMVTPPPPLSTSSPSPLSSAPSTPDCDAKASPTPSSGAISAPARLTDQRGGAKRRSQFDFELRCYSLPELMRQCAISVLQWHKASVPDNAHLWEQGDVLTVLRAELEQTAARVLEEQRALHHRTCSRHILRPLLAKTMPVLQRVHTENEAEAEAEVAPKSGQGVDADDEQLHMPEYEDVNCSQEQVTPAVREKSVCVMFTEPVAKDWV